MSMCFSDDGMTLASGGGDNDILIWDMVCYSAVYKLRGHKGPITSLLFTPNSNPNDSSSSSSSGGNNNTITTTTTNNSSSSSSSSGGRGSNDRTGYLVSSSTDTLLKVWDLTTAHCVQTIVGHR